MDTSDRIARRLQAVQCMSYVARASRGSGPTRKATLPYTLFLDHLKCCVTQVVADGTLANYYQAAGQHQGRPLEHIGNSTEHVLGPGERKNPS